MRNLASNRFFRWVAVIPGAILAALAVDLPWHWLVFYIATFVGHVEEGVETLGLGALVRLIGPESVERMGYGFINSFVVIVVAARIAPKYKLATAVTASVLVAVLIFGGWLFVSLNAGSYYLTVGVVRTLIANVLTIVAIFVAFKYKGARAWWEKGELPADESIN